MPSLESEETKKAIYLAIIIILSILFALGFFIWRNFLAIGNISIIGPTPFRVEVSESQAVDCNQSPCLIEENSGQKTLVISKDGYQSIVLNLEVPFRSTYNLEPNFQINPYVTQSTNYPQPDEEIIYSIVFDQSNNQYKLIDSNDSRERAIVYFSNEIREPIIISGPESALIIETGSRNNQIYRVNTKLSKRESIDGVPELFEIENGLWSDSGDLLLISFKESANYWLLDRENNLSELDLLSISPVDWLKSDNLIFVSTQSSDIINLEGKSDYKYVRLNERIVSGEYTFGIYDPSENSYSRIETFTDLPAQPFEVIGTETVSTIYFKVGNENLENNTYQLILKTF